MKHILTKLQGAPTKVSFTLFSNLQYYRHVEDVERASGRTWYAPQSFESFYLLTEVRYTI